MPVNDKEAVAMMEQLSRESQVKQFYLNAKKIFKRFSRHYIEHHSIEDLADDLDRLNKTFNTIPSQFNFDVSLKNNPRISDRLWLMSQHSDYLSKEIEAQNSALKKSLESFFRESKDTNPFYQSLIKFRDKPMNFILKSVITKELAKQHQRVDKQTTYVSSALKKLEHAIKNYDNNTKELKQKSLFLAQTARFTLQNISNEYFLLKPKFSDLSSFWVPCQGQNEDKETSGFMSSPTR
jgi:hypothetical protein